MDRRFWGQNGGRGEGEGEDYPPGQSPPRGALWLRRYPWSKFVKILRLGKIFRIVCMYVCITLESYRSGEDAPFPQYHSHDKATHSCREIRFFITLPQNTKSHLIGKVYAGSYFWVVCNMQQAWLLSRLGRCGAPAVPRELIVADGFTPITAASACWPASPASLSHGDVRYNHLLLSSRAAPPLRAFAILKNTLGVGQKRDHVKSVSQQFISVTNFCSTLKTLCQKTMY
ncbi:hypothetical protein HF086_006884 [Spodoptera exigua]|uniref:Uncharacterized protein n=1 Tax=Spodoptera exigua TaxID=7107 RepID=A0A922MHD2_SPOEX|nr:hypothetical protein HF086_006884 [Spodoptera exigua]